MKPSIKANKSASPRVIARARERELRMTREAIAMVAAGAAPRVVLAGINHGQEILDTARRLALESGVRVKSLPQANRDAADLVIEPIYE